jgi:diguanylate cyclase
LPIRRIQAIAGGAAVVLLAFASWLLFGWGGPATVATVSNLGSLTFTAFAFCCAAAAASTTSGRARVNWAALAFGLFSWLIGDLIWTYYGRVLHAQPPYPSVVDVAYLLLPVSVCLAWAFSAPIGSRLKGIRPLLDGLMVAGALFLICWVLVLDDLFSATDHTPLQIVVSMAYPVSDLVMITMGLIVLTGISAPNRRTMGVVISGLTTIALADCALVYLRIHGMLSGNVTGIGWAIGLLLVGTGALMGVGQQQQPPVDGPPSSRTLSWLPYFPMLLAVVVGFVHLWHVPKAGPILISAAVMVVAAMFRQLTVLGDNRGLRATMAEQALRDPLTGLANRLLFSDRLDHAMALRKRDGREVAVLSLDLDDFKLVNDNLGHPSGDALLKAVADRLLSLVPTGDAVARLGGDEFAILMEEGWQPAEELAQRVVEVFDKAFFLDGEEIFIHPSVGLAAASASIERELTADELSQRADLAMHTAKRAGVGGVQTFSDDMRHVARTGLATAQSEAGRNRRAPMVGIRLLGQLRRAIDERELILVYQPKINLVSGAMVGVEALVRWPHPELGLLTPNQFLPLVRQNGLMRVVTDLVLTTAVTDAAGWYEPDTQDVPVAINLFAPALDDMTLPDRISAALADAKLPPTALSFELTEHLLLANIRRARIVIDQLRARGLRIAIDDFGSGYATMSYLRELPIDELKLDRQFIAPILRSARSAAIVRSVIDLAHALGIACVAEGVEDGATAERLREYCCDIAQGHYFSRPISAAELRMRCQNGFSTSAIVT